MLPDLIRDAQAAVWQLDDDEERSAKAWLAWTYQLTAATAFKLGDAQLGWVAADRSIQLAEQTEDLTLIGNAARRVAHALSATYQHDDAVDFVRSAVDRLTPHLCHATPAFISAYGMLLLKGSISAARLYRAADVRDMQQEAMTIARQLSAGSNEHWSAFGATNVRVHQVSALADMQEAGRVVEAAEAVTSDELYALPKERQAAHLIDVTRGYVQSGQRDHAVTTLLDADQTSPEEVRCRPMTKQIVSDILYSYPLSSSAPAQLTRIATMLGVTT